MLIDRTWHTAYLAALWKKTVVHATEPTLRRLTQHRSLIRKLEFSISMNTQLASITFPNLRTVDFEGRDYETPAGFSMEVKSATCAFLFNNPSIITVVIHRSCVDWMAIAQMKSLRNLTIHRRPYDWLGSEFWTVCAQLESLQMDSIPETTIPGDISFPNLASLALIGVQPYTPNQLDFIRRCPNLRKLRLPFPRVSGEDEILDDFSRLAKENTWPRLCELDVFFLAVIEEAIITLLQNPGWKAWTVTHSVFEPKAFECLRNHFGTLEALSLKKCVYVTGKMLQEILSNCPLLREFHGNVIHARVIANGRPWVCTSLRVFSCLIDCSRMKRSDPWTRTQEMTQDDGIQRRVFEMFSRPRKLEHIVVGVDYGKAVGLHLIVGKGLELLKDCRHITEIDFDGTDQFITGNDAQWMTNHWKELKQVRGTLNHDREANRISETILFDHQCQVNDRDEHEGSEYEDGDQGD
jgi:hypothetical protein